MSGDSTNQITAAVLGGEGSFIGILLGAALLQVLQNLVNLSGIPSSLNSAVMGLVILIGVLSDEPLGNLMAPRGTQFPAANVAESGPSTPGPA
jgi:ribose transport system permease protein